MLCKQQRDLIERALDERAAKEDIQAAKSMIMSLRDGDEFLEAMQNAHSKVKKMEAELSHESEQRRILDSINADLHEKLRAQDEELKELAIGMRKYEALVVRLQDIGDDLQKSKERQRELSFTTLEEAKHLKLAEDELLRLRNENSELTGRLSGLKVTFEKLSNQSAEERVKLLQESSYMGLEAKALLNEISETTNLRQAVNDCLSTLESNEMVVSNLKSHSRTLETDFTEVVEALVQTQKTATAEHAALQECELEIVNAQNQSALQEGSIAQATEAVFAELEKSDLQLHEYEAEVSTLKIELEHAKDDNQALIMRQNQQASELEVKNTLIDEMMTQNRQLLVENERFQAEISELTANVHQLSKKQMIKASFVRYDQHPGLEQTEQNYMIESAHETVIEEDSVPNPGSESQSKVSTESSGDATPANVDENPLEKSGPAAEKETDISIASEKNFSEIESPAALKEELQEEPQFAAEADSKPPIESSSPEEINAEECETEPSKAKASAETLNPCLPEDNPAVDETTRKPTTETFETNTKLPPRPSGPSSVPQAGKLPMQRPPKQPLKQSSGAHVDVLNLSESENVFEGHSELQDVSLLGENSGRRADLNMVDSRFDLPEDAVENEMSPDMYADLDRFISHEDQAKLEAEQPFDNEISINYESIMEARDEYNPRIIVDEVSAHESMLNDDADAMASVHANNADESLTYVDGVYFGNIEKVGAQRDESSLHAANATINSFTNEQQNLRAKRKTFQKRTE